MSKLEIAIASLLTLLAGLIFYPFASLGVDPHHDGIMLKPALDVLSGQVLFRDTFSQYGPLTTYLQALALGVSPTLLSLRLLTGAAYAASLFFLYLAWRSLLPRSLAVVAGLMFILYAPFYDPDWLMFPWSSVLALLFQSVAIWALLRIVAGHTHAAWAWTLGISCACTLWCRQPVGIILTGSVGVIAVALYGVGWRSPGGASMRVWVRVACGFGGIGALVLGHLVMNGALGAWWEQNILWPQRWARSVGGHDPLGLREAFLRMDHALGLFGLLLLGLSPALLRRYRPTLPRWFDLVWLTICVLAYVCFASDWAQAWLLIPTGGWSTLIVGLIILQTFFVLLPLIWRRSSLKSLDFFRLAALSGVTLGSLLQLYPYPCPHHVFWALAPALGLGIYLCWRWSRAEASLCAIVILLLLIPASYYKYQRAQYNLQQPAITLESPVAFRGMRVGLERAQALQRIDEVLRPLLAANPDRPGLLYGDDAIYLAWFKNGQNPSPYYVNWGGLLSPDDWRKRAFFIEDRQPVLFFVKPRRLEEVGKFLQAVGYEVVYNEAALNLFIALPIPPKSGSLTP